MAPTRTGSVRQRGSTWQARIQDPDGRQRSASFPTQRHAERWVRDQVADRKQSPSAANTKSPTRRTAPPFAEWAETWRADQVDLRPSSLARADSAIRSRLVPDYGHFPLDQIDAAMVRRWVSRLVGEGLAPATVTRLLRVLGSILQVAASDGLIPANPARGIRPPRSERQEQRFLSAAEVARLTNAIDKRWRGLVLVAAYGGLRFGELTGLTVKRINPLHATITIAEQIVEVGGHLVPGAPKTRAGRRTVPVPRLVIDELGPHLARKAPDDLLFTAPEGGPIRRTLWAKRVWLPAVTAAGLAPLRIHDLRHTAVSIWVEAGASPLEIARRAGHAKTATILDIYGHLSPDGYEATTARLDEMARAAAAAATTGNGA